MYVRVAARLCFKARCKALVMKMIFYSHGSKTHAHKKGFALSLVLKVRDFVTQKWPIYCDKCNWYSKNL